MAKKNTTNININDFNSNDNTELCTITDEVPSDGTCIATFSFNNTSAPLSKNLSSDAPIAPTSINTETQEKTQSSNSTSSIDGESLNVKRTYMLKNSTVRKLNTLKSLNPDISIYISKIVDLAINHYYEHITNKNTD